jgi:hypothetical protein
LLIQKIGIPSFNKRAWPYETKLAFGVEINLKQVSLFGWQFQTVHSSQLWQKVKEGILQC